MALLSAPLMVRSEPHLYKRHEQREMGSSKGDIRKAETPPTQFHLPTPVANIWQELRVTSLVAHYSGQKQTRSEPKTDMPLLFREMRGKL